MADTARSERLRTPECRAAYVNVFTPRPSRRAGGKPRYELVLLIPKTENISYLKAEAVKVGKAKFGEGFVDGVKAKKYHSPFRDGDAERPGKPEFAGMVFITAKANNQPGVVDRKRNPITTPEEFGSGDYCIAMVNFFAFDNESKGVACGLIGLQRVRKGEPLDSRVDAATLFDELEGGEEAGESGSGNDDFGI